MNARRIAVTAWASIYAVGAAGQLLPALGALTAPATPLVLALGAASVVTAVLIEAAGDRLRTVLWMGAVAAAGFAVEALGVASAFPFGSYSYGETLGPKALQVPLVIALSWLTVVTGGLAIAERSGRARAVAPLIVGLCAFATDLIMEPAAVRLGYWSWAGGGVPAANYLSWFVLATLFALGARALRVRVRSLFPFWYLLIQAAFFVTVDAASLVRH